MGAGLVCHYIDVDVAADGSVTFEMPGAAMASLTTTTGQGWRRPTAAAIPASAPFPFPFADNFDAAPRGGSARYFSDMGGVWEATPLPTALAVVKPGGSGGGNARGAGADQALLQVVPADPAQNGWCANPLPSTVVGNPNGGEQRVPCALTQETRYPLAHCPLAGRPAGPPARRPRLPPTLPCSPIRPPLSARARRLPGPVPGPCLVD